MVMTTTISLKIIVIGVPDAAINRKMQVRSNNCPIFSQRGKLRQVCKFAQSNAVNPTRRCNFHCMWNISLAAVMLQAIHLDLMLGKNPADAAAPRGTLRTAIATLASGAQRAQHNPTYRNNTTWYTDDAVNCITSSIPYKYTDHTCKDIMQVNSLKKNSQPLVIRMDVGSTQSCQSTVPRF